jgi:hypothetical protein
MAMGIKENRHGASPGKFYDLNLIFRFPEKPLNLRWITIGAGDEEINIASSMGKRVQ